ncbi:MAG: hypothetical protein QXF52_10300 [Thermoproteota archaeon]
MGCKWRSMVVMLFIVVLLSPSVSPFLMRVSSLGQQYRVLMDFYHRCWNGYPGYPTITQLLRDEGYAVDENHDKPLNEVSLSSYDALLLVNPWDKFSQDELNAIKSFVENGGGLLLTVDTQFYYGNTNPNDVAGLFGVSFYGDMVMSASIVDFNHPITRDKSQSDLFNPFLLWDAAIKSYPSNAVVLVRAGSTLSALSIPNGTSIMHSTIESSVAEDPVAMVALNYGKGRAVFGPCNGLTQPWGKPNYYRNEANKMLLNTVEWLVSEIPSEILDAEAELYGSSIATLRYMRNQMTDMTIDVVTDLGAEIFGMAFTEGFPAMNNVEKFKAEEISMILETLVEAANTQAAILRIDWFLGNSTMVSEIKIYNKHAEFINTPIKLSPEANISALVKDIFKITREINATSEVVNKIRRAYDLIEASKNYAYWAKIGILIGGGFLIVFSMPFGLEEPVATALLAIIQSIEYYELGATATQGLTIVLRLYDFHEANKRISTIYTDEVDMAVSSLETGRLLIPSGEVVETDYPMVIDSSIGNFSALFKNTGLVSTNARMCVYVGAGGPYYSKSVTVEPGDSKLLSISIPFVTIHGAFPIPAPYGTFWVQIRVEYGFCYETYTAFQNFTCNLVPNIDIWKQATLIPAGKSETTITITVTNYENAPVNITVVDEIPKSLASTLDEVVFITPYTRVVEPDPKVEWVLSLMPNETKQIKYRISVPVLEVGQFIELPAPIIIYLDPSTGRMMQREGPRLMVTASDAAVSLTNVTAPGKVFVGEVFPLTASLKNLGEADATNVGVTIILPEGLSLVSDKNVTIIGTLTSEQNVNTT